mmetsp:Transcript_26461/g.68729  ORF Transcript_26461/g.68729 Transcript_26461/m.68729 type:complete len:234 (+) Transcript_26461:432-1133(+)
MIASASLMIDFIARKASRGYFPAAVSPDSMTASAPSNTAAATSVTSALVGRGWRIMESSICVATITGFPTRLHASTMYLCAAKTFSKSISTPRSPRATMTPSEASKMPSKLSTPSWFSIFDIIWGMRVFWSGQHRSMKALHERTFLADLTNDSATKSAPVSTAHWMSSLSLGVSAGRSKIEPGRFTPFLALIGPAFSAMAVTESLPIFVTTSDMSPSSNRIFEPIDTVAGRDS